MRSILHQLYYGEISPSAQYEGRLEEYHQLREKQHQEYQTFVEGLEPQQKEEFLRIMNHQFDTIPMEYADTFADGFRLGVKMMLAVFQKELTGKD